MRLFLGKKPKLGQLLDDGVTGIESLLSLEDGAGIFIEGSIFVQDVDELKLVTSAQLVIIEVVSWR